MIIEQNVIIERFHQRNVLRPLTQVEKDQAMIPYIDPPSREPMYIWTNQVSKVAPQLLLPPFYACDRAAKRLFVAAAPNRRPTHRHL